MQKLIKVNSYTNAANSFAKLKEITFDTLKNCKMKTKEVLNRRAGIDIMKVKPKKTYSNKYSLRSFSEYARQNYSGKINKEARAFVNKNILPTKETLFDKMLSYFSSRRSVSKNAINKKSEDYSDYKSSKETPLRKIKHSSYRKSSARWKANRIKVYKFKEEEPNLLNKQLAITFIKKDATQSRINNCKMGCSDFYKVRIIRSNSYAG